MTRCAARVADPCLSLSWAARDSFLRAMPRSSPELETPDTDVKATSEIEIDDTSVLMGLCGPRNERLKVMERELGIEVGLRGHTIFLRGSAANVAVAERFLAEAATLLKQG